MIHVCVVGWKLILAMDARIGRYSLPGPTFGSRASARVHPPLDCHLDGVRGLSKIGRKRCKGQHAMLRQMTK